MAISLSEYESLSSDRLKAWNDEADLFETQIDAAFTKAVSENIVPNIKNANFVLRFMFPNRVSKEAKDILKIRYTNLGWKIIEQIDFKDVNYTGYFDFYKK